MQTEQILISASAIAEGFLIPLGNGQVTSIGKMCSLGRDAASDLVLTDTFASNRHARIDQRASQFVIRDLGSRNGTFVNGNRIVEAVLALGDKVRIGETTFVFSETPAEATELVSKNLAWNEQLRRLPAFASTEFPVLISGPSGSGKELLAQAIHRSSRRARGAFVGINCSALNESLIESELFGHKKGAFTGAINDREGAFESARGGTLFLDEIGDLPLSLQPKLLRALEAGEIRPLGSDRVITTDVRIVAATHKNLGNAIRDGRFREDLFYRLNVCHLRPPALRDRLEDFDDLMYAFARQFKVRFSFGATAVLKQHPWHGNIRELRNVVARSSAYYPGLLIQADDLQSVLEGPSIASIGPEIHFVAESAQRPVSVLREIERDMILRQLVANSGNQRQTAKDLGMAKSTLHDRIKAYAIDVKQFTTEKA